MRYLPGTKTPAVTFNFWYPRMGVTPAQVTIDAAAMTDFEYDVDGTQQAWQVIEKGSGSGGLQPVPLFAAQVGAAGYPLFGKAFSHSQVNTASVLQNIGEGDLSIYAWPVAQPTIVVAMALPRRDGTLDPAMMTFGDVGAGDDVTLVVDAVAVNAQGVAVYGENNDPRFPNGMNFDWRAVAWTANIPAKGVPTFTFNLAVPPSLASNPTRPPR
jgi:hypothetical protein